LKIYPTETYNYQSISEIDPMTFDYVSFVLPSNIYETPIEEVNEFLNGLEKFYAEIECEKETGILNELCGV